MEKHLTEKVKIIIIDKNGQRYELRVREDFYGKIEVAFQCGVLQGAKVTHTLVAKEIVKR